MVHFIKIDACTREVLFRHFIKSVSHAGQAFCKQHTSGAAGIEMALPGDCPVKQSFTTDLLREKGTRKKTTTSGSETFLWNLRRVIAKNREGYSLRNHFVSFLIVVLLASTFERRKLEKPKIN